MSYILIIVRECSKIFRIEGAPAQVSAGHIFHKPEPFVPIRHVDIDGKPKSGRNLKNGL